jgi:hypothetical protein
MSMPVSDVDPTLRSIKPDGLPLAILVLSCVFLGLSIITVSLRTYIRIAKGAFGLDDKFMVLGCVSSCLASYSFRIASTDSGPDCLHRCHGFGDLRCAHRSRTFEQRSERMAAKRVPEVLYHLDPGIRLRPRNRQIVNLYHNHANCQHQNEHEDYSLRAPRCHMGVFLHHLHWDSPLLLTGQRHLDTNVSHNWQGDMCASTDIRYHRPHRYRFHHLD